MACLRNRGKIPAARDPERPRVNAKSLGGQRGTAARIRRPVESPTRLYSTAVQTRRKG